jgi:hypothetical protein
VPDHFFPQQAGSCVPAPDLAAPASICCENFNQTCHQITTTSQASISAFIWNCRFTNYPNDPYVAGTCGADGHCVPAH